MVIIAGVLGFGLGWALALISVLISMYAAEERWRVVWGLSALGVVLVVFPFLFSIPPSEAHIELAGLVGGLAVSHGIAKGVEYGNRA